MTCNACLIPSVWLPASVRIISLLKSLAPADWAEFIAKQGDDAVAGMTHELQVLNA
jgi:hypothetical protein